MTTLDESSLNYSTINEINNIIEKKKSEIESLTRVRDDLLRALKEEFIVISDDKNKSENIGILMGTSSRYYGKVKVKDVLPESLAANSGVIKGDIIKKINNTMVDNLCILNVKKLIISASKRRDDLTINIQRNNEVFDIIIDKNKK
jgi:C-terminal processing protease CtpA/Prc